MLSNKQQVEEKLYTIAQVYKILEERYLYYSCDTLQNENNQNYFIQNCD